jgi:hypothetical protein
MLEALMQSVEFTLKERAGRMYRQLLLLHQIFQQPSDPDAEWSGAGASNTGLRDAIKEVIDELTDHAGILMSAPFPISEWRSGDGPDDERWRALTEMERRELLALVTRYEDLIAWSEVASSRPVGAPQTYDADYLQTQRVQLTRFRKEVTFLERRRKLG